MRLFALKRETTYLHITYLPEIKVTIKYKINQPVSLVHDDFLVNLCSCPVITFHHAVFFFQPGGIHGKIIQVNFIVCIFKAVDYLFEILVCQYRVIIKAKLVSKIVRPFKELRTKYSSYTIFGSRPGVVIFMIRIKLIVNKPCHHSGNVYIVGFMLEQLLCREPIQLSRRYSWATCR